MSFLGSADDVDNEMVRIVVEESPLQMDTPGVRDHGRLQEFRYSEGVTPVAERKARVKALWS